MAVSVVHFSRYNSKFTVTLSLGVIIYSKTNVGFGISDDELTIYDPPCVKVMKDHPRSNEVTDLG